MSPIGAIGGVVPYFDMGLAVCGAVPSMLAVATGVLLYCGPIELEDSAKGGEFLFELPLKQLGVVTEFAVKKYVMSMVKMSATTVTIAVKNTHVLVT